MSTPGELPRGRRVTARDILARKGTGERIVMVTAYDALFGRLVDEAGVDVVLVGDSVGNVVAGFDSTIAVTLEQMIYHGAAVRRGVRSALLVVDLPFLSYQGSAAQAVRNCGRVLRETGAQAIKLEGADAGALRAVHVLASAGVPVMGHLGLTPQSIHALGGHRVQGRDEESADRMLEAARQLEGAGAFSIVLELVPAELARRITDAVAIPTVGIGAGAGCDGQVLVLPDLLGLNDRFHPRFLKRYASLADEVRRAVGTFGDDVRAGTYPDAEHSF